ncbi:MAG: DUF4131 domain-containing protein [Draconibacterium sp.]|nr:DUF4131 domain-containing protein [Draconibacterium sp.]
MEKSVQQIPFLRPTITLVIGIYTGSVLDFPITLLLAISTTIFFSLLYINKNYTFRIFNLFGIVLHLLFIFIGILVYEIYNTGPTFIENGNYTAIVLEKPQEKNNSYKSVIKVITVKNDSIITKSDEKILVYFEKHNQAEQLQPGNTISFSTTPQLLKNYGNPFEFDYKEYLKRKKIYRQLYLATNNWEKKSTVTKLTLPIRAELFRDKLLEIYRRQNLGENELEILSALTLGYKRNLDPETKRVFSASGAMHILAVSGLHVGIIFWVITLLFGFLRKQKTSRVMFVIVSIILLWAYAFITGLSPSVMRASAMFTIFVIGENISRKPNSYNSLAASAMFLLLFNPNNLFEVGFQLSYSAVFGILFLQPKLSSLIKINNKFVRFFWTLLTVSVAAQISTFPLTTYYFNQFPSYFWITNLIIIPAVMVLIPLGISLLIFAKIPVLSVIISTVIQFIIKWCYIILSQIEQLPLSVHEISVHPIQFIFLLGFLLSLYLFLRLYNIRYLKAILIFTLFLAISYFTFQLKQNSLTGIIVYNNTNNTTIQLIRGKTNFVISEHKLKNSSNILNTIKNTNLNLKIDVPTLYTITDTIKNEFLLLKNRVIIFEGKTVIFNKNLSNIEKSITPDFIINPKNINETVCKFATNATIINSNKKYKKDKLDTNLIYHTTNLGAFVEKW